MEGVGHRNSLHLVFQPNGRTIWGLEEKVAYSFPIASLSGCAGLSPAQPWQDKVSTGRTVENTVFMYIGGTAASPSQRTCHPKEKS